MLQFMKNLLKDVATAIVATGATLDGCKIGLFKNDVTITKNTVMADLELCDFSGYAPSDVLDWGTPYLDQGTGDWALSPGAVEFRSATATPFVQNAVYGYCVYLPGTPNVLKLAEKFSAPRLIVEADQVISIRPEVVGLSGSSVVTG